MNALTKTLAVVAALIALGGLSGCSDGGAGGKTTCGQFDAMDAAQREKVVTKMMQDHGDQASEIDVRSMAILLDFYCANVAAGDAIDGVYSAS